VFYRIVKCIYGHSNNIEYGIQSIGTKMYSIFHKSFSEEKMTMGDSIQNIHSFEHKNENITVIV